MPQPATLNVGRSEHATQRTSPQPAHESRTAVPRLIRFDVLALHAALDEQRKARGLSWHQVGKETCLGHWVFGRMRTAGISVEALAVMLLWLDNTDLRPYIKEVPTDAR